MSKNTLILVDLQNDFMPGGALAVTKGDEVVPVANRLITSCKFDLIVATQDHHPPSHKSFASSHKDKKIGDIIDLNGVQQFLWPDHCVWGTDGAAFHKNLLIGRVNLILRKGTNPEIDSYSGLYDNNKGKTGLIGYLDDNKAGALYIVGLATDYCVKYTAMDAVQSGFDTYLIEDGCRAVNITPTDGQEAIEAMRKIGVHITNEKNSLAMIDNMKAHPGGVIKANEKP